jgi:predicted dienelactone hydrolase
MAPAVAEAFQSESLTRIQIPLEIVVGASDDQAPPETNAAFLAQNIPNSALTVLPAPAGHYTFLDECTDIGKHEMPQLCMDAEGVDRAAIHARVTAMAKKFFDDQLKRL